NCTPTIATATTDSGGRCEEREISQAEVAISPIAAATEPAPSSVASARRPAAGRAIAKVWRSDASGGCLTAVVAGVPEGETSGAAWAFMRAPRPCGARQVDRP